MGTHRGTFLLYASATYSRNLPWEQLNNFLYYPQTTNYKLQTCTQPAVIIQSERLLHWNLWWNDCSDRLIVIPVITLVMKIPDFYVLTKNSRYRNMCDVLFRVTWRDPIFFSGIKKTGEKKRLPPVTMLYPAHLACSLKRTDRCASRCVSGRSQPVVHRTLCTGDQRW